MTNPTATPNRPKSTVVPPPTDSMFPELGKFVVAGATDVKAAPAEVTTAFVATPP